jgi:hypothetical protein
MNKRHVVMMTAAVLEACLLTALFAFIGCASQDRGRTAYSLGFQDFIIVETP